MWGYDIKLSGALRSLWNPCFAPVSSPQHTACTFQLCIDVFTTKSSFSTPRIWPTGASKLVADFFPSSSFLHRLPLTAHSLTVSRILEHF
ncbi:hypothetical protein Mapa_005913 [Marchantia paleacea]|nr:hypothetical protein Mapa_005913 [Marchantia paleacea]